MTRDPQRSTQTLERSELARPRLFRVLLLNDDYTPMDFVVTVLRQYFHQSEAQATAVMLAVHGQGQGVAGVYTREIAETKTAQVVQHARREGHPLELSIEPDAEV